MAIFPPTTSSAFTQRDAARGFGVGIATTYFVTHAADQRDCRHIQSGFKCRILGQLSTQQIELSQWLGKNWFETRICSQNHEVRTLQATQSFTASRITDPYDITAQPASRSESAPALVLPDSAMVRRIPTDIESEKPLHDARNLIGAFGLYCDLLSMPDVLKPEHIQYVDELRILSSRAWELIENLILSKQVQVIPASPILSDNIEAVGNASSIGSLSHSRWSTESRVSR